MHVKIILLDDLKSPENVSFFSTFNFNKPAVSFVLSKIFFCNIHRNQTWMMFDWYLSLYIRKSIINFVVTNVPVANISFLVLKILFSFPLIQCKNIKFFFC